MPRLRHVVQAFAEEHCPGDDDLGPTVALAVTEACTNVVRHAYPDGSGELLLTAGIVGDWLVIEIIDHGIGLDRATVFGSPGLGVGIGIMQEIGNARIASSEHGTRVEMRFACS